MKLLKIIGPALLFTLATLLVADEGVLTRRYLSCLAVLLILDSFKIIFKMYRSKNFSDYQITECEGSFVMFGSIVVFVSVLVYGHIFGW